MCVIGRMDPVRWRLDTNPAYPRNPANPASDEWLEIEKEFAKV